jgi:hypothetical protein
VTRQANAKAAVAAANARPHRANTRGPLRSEPFPASWSTGLAGPKSSSELRSISEDSEKLKFDLRLPDLPVSTILTNGGITGQISSKTCRSTFPAGSHIPVFDLMGI